MVIYPLGMLYQEALVSFPLVAEVLVTSLTSISKVLFKLNL